LQLTDVIYGIDVDLNHHDILFDQVIEKKYNSNGQTSRHTDQRCVERCIKPIFEIRHQQKASKAFLVNTGKDAVSV